MENMKQTKDVHYRLSHWHMLETLSNYFKCQLLLQIVLMVISDNVEMLRTHI